MSENLSIEEILRQAEEIRKRTVKKAQSALEEVDNYANETSDKTIEVPRVSNDALDKTAVVDTQEVKSVAAVHNEKTKIIDQKTKTVKLDDKTGVVKDIKNIASQKKSFFNNQADEPLYSKAPPEIIERPATIRSKSKFDKTSDLEEIPTIVAVDELEHTRISTARYGFRTVQDNTDYDEGEQIVLDGFKDLDEQISTIDEDVAEKQLRERRKEKVNKFRLFGSEDIAADKNARTVIENDYNNDDEKTAFLEKLFASKSSITLSVTMTLVISILIGLLTVFKDSAYMPSFLLDYTAYFIAVFALYLITIVINGKTIIHGFNFKNGVNSDFPVSLVCLIVLVHTGVMMFDSDLFIDDGNVYALVGAFALFFSGIGKRAMLTRIIGNFEFLISQEEKHTVENIINAVDATIISRGVLSGEANLKTSIKTDFPTNFLDIASSDEPADAIAKTTGFIMIGLNAVLFAVFAVMTKNWHVGFNMAMCGLCISLPCMALLETNTALLGVSKSLEKNGSMINGFEGSKVVDNANAIVLEAQDLFGPKSCEIHGIKMFNGAKADDVILKTAAVIMKTKSPLSYVFDDVVIGKQTILPEVESVIYEDRLGTSAWIYKKKVLVGTRELLIHHGIRVPKEEFEAKYTRKGRKILYLAVTGKVMAMFVVSYNADPKLKKALRKLEKSGMTVLVKSSDPFINDESIAELFSLPDGFVRVMTSSNGRAFEKYSNMCVEKSPAYVVHNGTALGFVSAMCGAENLEETRKILSVMISFGCAIGFGVVTLLGFTGGMSELNAISVIVFQSLWCIFVELLSKLKRLGL